MTESMVRKYDILKHEVNRFGMHSDNASRLCAIYDIKFALQLLEEEVKKECGYYGKASESEDTNI